MDDIIEKIKSVSELTIKEEMPKFLNKNFQGLTITKENFQPINNQGKKSIAFIDGGNAELIKTSNLSVNYIRIVKVGSNTIKKEFFLIVTVKNNNYIASWNNETLEIPINDEGLRQGNAYAGISQIPGLVRRLEELKMIEESSEDIVIIDGSLEPKFDIEKEILDKTTKQVAGLCKTNSLITTNGHSVQHVLMTINKSNNDNLQSWIYHPICISKTNFDIAYVKLQEKSNYCFRLDFQKGTNNLQSICYNLKLNSKDPIFFGYPYNLIKVDKLARISNQEKEYLRTKLQIKLGKSWEDINQLENSHNAHSILDNIA